MGFIRRGNHYETVVLDRAFIAWLDANDVPCYEIIREDGFEIRTYWKTRKFLDAAREWDAFKDRRYNDSHPDPARHMWYDDNTRPPAL